MKSDFVLYARPFLGRGGAFAPTEAYLGTSPIGIEVRYAKSKKILMTLNCFDDLLKKRLGVITKIFSTLRILAFYVTHG